MNRSYNHIKHLVEINDKSESYKNTLRRRRRIHFHQGGSHNANQVSGKQRHSGFDDYECDMMIIGYSGGWAE